MNLYHIVKRDAGALPDDIFFAIFDRQRNEMDLEKNKIYQIYRDLKITVTFVPLPRKMATCFLKMDLFLAVGDKHQIFLTSFPTKVTLKIFSEVPEGTGIAMTV